MDGEDLRSPCHEVKHFEPSQFIQKSLEIPKVIIGWRSPSQNDMIQTHSICVCSVNIYIYKYPLSPTIMEEENYPTKWKETNIGGTHFSLPWLWEEGYTHISLGLNTHPILDNPFQIFILSPSKIKKKIRMAIWFNKVAFWSLSFFVTVDLLWNLCLPNPIETTTSSVFPYITSWWFQPSWKIFVKMGIFPK